MTCVGLEKNLQTIPAGLHCVKIAVAAEDDLVRATVAHVKEHQIAVDRIVAMSSCHLQYAAALRTLLGVAGEQEADFALAALEAIAEGTLPVAAFDPTRCLTSASTA